MTGSLILVATPIGNLGDLSPRAIEELAKADVICCEDTRRTGRLLAHAGVEKRPLMVVNDHSEAGQVRAVPAPDRGERVAVVTDAGTPGISDPGERLVRAASAAGHRIEVVPGPSAAIVALVASGLPTGRFCFEGFLPRRGSGRTERLEALASERRTIVLYEAPHRLAVARSRTWRARWARDRRVAIAGELTKLHEEVWRGRLSDAADAVVAPAVELVLIVQGAPESGLPPDEEVEAALRRRLAAGLGTKAAATEVAEELGVSKRVVYACGDGPDDRAGVISSA